ncbi:kinase-like domain-containing protein [Gilbertella persicaria]|uniref:kinase-like domain-containing protein n=1 Tax=Gilbertella persicaria TaxID=101096 RepID=UPI00221FC9F2|nr:kinase-like domain-containing protein [Gilbertella persicaria]KAI8080259.1 kinase-like domain-containing protein [Gilbertella persicaria]
MFLHSALDEDGFTQTVSLLLSQLFDIHDTSLQLERVSGALTNAVFFVTASHKRMLLRVYGVGCEQILDRNKELDWLSRLSELHIGPRLLGIFGNGRFEEYLPSTTLTCKDIRTSFISLQIASRLHQLHSIVNTFPPEPNEPLEVWTNIDKWFAALDLALLKSKHPDWTAEIESKLDVDSLRDEIEWCKSILMTSTSPTVFAHNDTQYGNILKINGTEELVVIDFEYAGYNPRAMDIVNHFCEWMYDYHSQQPAKMHVDQYPTLQEQSLFLASYLNTQDQTQIQALQAEVDAWKMACHLFWALWGLVQASQSEIEFDYLSYSLQRIKAFRTELDHHRR